jgi:hypothetical protein
MFRRSFFASFFAPFLTPFIGHRVSPARRYAHIVAGSFFAICRKDAGCPYPDGYGVPVLRDVTPGPGGMLTLVSSDPPDMTTPIWPYERQIGLQAVLRVGTIDELVAAYRADLERTIAQALRDDVCGLWADTPVAIAEEGIHEYREMPRASPELLAARQYKCDHFAELFPREDRS